MIDEEKKKIKESFKNIKEDMFYLQQELIILRQEINEIKQILQFSTSSAEVQHTTHNPVHNLLNYTLKSPNFYSSTRNEGVPADRQQTDSRQINALKRTFDSTLRDTENLRDLKDFHDLQKFSKIQSSQPTQSSEFSFSPISISNFINNLKKDLGEKFKKLTQKEFLIFSVLYTLEEEFGSGGITYSDIAKHTGLTESSIRDYIARLIHKNIPIIKEKPNNRVVILKIPRELKDIATLDKLSRLKKFF